MKVSGALCALSLASWTLAVPIVRTLKHSPPRYSGPQITSPDTWPIRTAKFAVWHEAGAQDALEGRPDNSPYSPSSDVAPSVALAAPRPLKTSYLLAIKPFMLSAEGKASEDKASIQPDCLESSTVNEETGSVMRHDPTIVELETEGNKPFYRKVPCALPQGHVNHVRPHADMTVVGIVFALIALIVIIELWDSIRTTVGRLWHGEGGIRLEDSPDEKELLKRQYSDFILQAPPKSRTKSSSISGKPDDDL